MTRLPLRADEEGAFMVFEAVLVAILIFTAILFFTGVGRPTDATDPGGLDLSQNASDILYILETRSFGIDADGNGIEDATRPMRDNASNNLTGEGWVTRLVKRDNVTRFQVNELASELVPKGALYILRLTNGHDNLELAPGNGRTPHGARVAEMMVFPAQAYNSTHNPAINATNMEPAAGLATPYPVYGLQLVVWFGA